LAGTLLAGGTAHSVCAAYILTTLVSFDNTGNGVGPGPLIADASGNLCGTIFQLK